MTNLSLARIMYGTSEDHRKIEGYTPAFLFVSNDSSFMAAHLRELLRRVWRRLSPKH